MHDKRKVELSEVIAGALAQPAKKLGYQGRRSQAKKLVKQKPPKDPDLRPKKILSDLAEIRKLKQRRPNRPPMAWSYGRVSHRDQLSGESVPAQVQRCEDYYTYKLHKEGIDWGGSEIEAKNESARRKSFIHRPAGQKLIGLLQRGDHLIVDKVDRMWRNLRDFANLLQLFKDCEIHVHFVSFSGCSVEIGTPMGDFFLTMMVAVAQLESDRVGERTKAAYEWHLAHGGSRCTYILAGATCTRTAGVEHYEWDREMRDWMRRLVEIEEKKGFLTIDDRRDIEIEYRVSRKGMTEDEAIHSTMHCKSFYFSKDRCYRLTLREREYTHYGIEDPNLAARYPLISLETARKNPRSFAFVGPRMKAKMANSGRFLRKELKDAKDLPPVVRAP